MRFSLWHRLLCFLGIRNEFDYSPPGLGPEVNHPYYRHDALQCCAYCGGGHLHPIHKPPYNPRREAEVKAAEVERAKSRYQRAVEDWMGTDSRKDTMYVNPALLVPPLHSTNAATDFRAYVEREH